MINKETVDPVYDIAIHSYDLLINRINSMDSKLQSLIVLSCAITFAIPVLLEKPSLKEN